MWHIHTTDYYLVMKRNEVVIDTTTFMNLRNIKLNLKRQSQMTIV